MTRNITQREQDGKMLQMYRKKARVPLRKMSEKLGKPPTSLSAIERGRMETPLAVLKGYERVCELQPGTPAMRQP